MVKMNPFIDDRKIPQISINVKIKVDTNSVEDNTRWNEVFGYLMRKPRTKLEFINIIDIRKLNLDEITLEKIKTHIAIEDYEKLKMIEDVFDSKLTQDVKAFILSILKIKPSIIENL